MNYNKTNYELILQTAISCGFEFVDFSTVEFGSPRKQIILRHDIDTSIAMAYEAAKIDAKYTIKATFALQVSSPLYNPFTIANIKTVNEIHLLGHNIALHHRVIPRQTNEETRQGIIREMQTMRIFFPYIQPMFVWHNQSLNNLFNTLEITGIVNAYNASPARRMHYISDSVLRNKPEDFLTVLNKHKFIQMLLHPTVWMSGKNNIVAMFTYALSDIMRECGYEFMLNPVWAEKFPNGIPKEFLDKLEAILDD